MKKRTLVRTTLAMVVGAALAMTVQRFYPQLVTPTATQADSAPSEPQPLYWVAPMDPNFRRDQPGLSPMGMELVPVYPDDAASNSAGSVKISAQLANQLALTQQPVKRAPWRDERLLAAEVLPHPQATQAVQVRFSGWVESLAVNAAGDGVSEGQPLLSIYSPELVTAQQELLSARGAMLKGARERLRALGMSSEWIQNVRRAGKIQQQVAITAPQAGLLLDMPLALGQQIRPGQTLLRITDPSRVWLQVQVAGQALATDLSQAELQVRSASGDWQTTKLHSLAPLANQQGRQRIQASIAGEHGLMPGDWVEARWVSESEPVLQIPAQALIDDGVQTRAVVRLADDTFKSVAVVAGRRSHTVVEVLQGLSANDVVVTSAQFLIDSESMIDSDLLRYAKQDHSGMDHSGMDHSNMDHSNMDHSNMDHSNMDHSNMDHSNMDHSNMNHAAQPAKDQGAKHDSAHH
ncbi:hypothetical protein GCM10011297_09320 [Bacterioplanes sanyensis]|uniref:efflux RND transporter periplasmic adaptor subunit n=1 Tax=Bacterioplanes sanyensis TaxID=1249553 RepID=UPI00167BF308|nr:efflux RND transporter periplasmic adaptor subunit [Bacterioplanes sanyensis]GGY38291.1 hypothetical protein GCM10011297_09320 [Bacterioplanes sanyensis]